MGLSFQLAAMCRRKSYIERSGIIKRKTYQELSFTDDFMFGKVLGEHTDLCKRLAEVILNRKIGNVISVRVQDYYKDSYYGKAVILDVHFEDDMNNICTIEMQLLKVKTLVKRSRYYLSLTDIESLNAGDEYDMLKNNYFVMICPFDLFGAEEAIYWFENYHIGRETIPLNDGRYTIFLNASADYDESGISSELREFLHFVRTSEATGALTSEIDEYVHEAKHNRKWERDYMLFIDRLAEERREGYAEGYDSGYDSGFDIGQQNAILELYQDGYISAEITVDKLGISIEELEVLLKEN